MVNVTFFALIEIAVLIQGLAFGPNTPYPEEAHLVVVLIGIPFSVIAIINGVLYALARRARPSLAR
jgi:ABC-type sulfate transport system permease subunit